MSSPLWRDRYPILAPEHGAELEARAAVRELADGIPPRQAEADAHRDYLQTHMVRAAAHHLAGIRAAHAAGDLEEAARHSLRYGVIARAMGYDPQGEPPEEVASLSKDPQHTKVYRFAGHDADALLLNHLLGQREMKKGEGDEDDDPVADHERLGRLGYHPDHREARRTSPGVDWEAQDLQDPHTAVNAQTVGQTYSPTKKVPRHRQVYPALVPTSDVPSPVLAEEVDRAIDQHDNPGDWEGGGPEEDYGYDWSEIDRGRRGGTFPPAKLYRDAKGEVHILDGNHRITRWQDWHQHIPAWVIDDQPPATAARPQPPKRKVRKAEPPLAGILVKDEGDRSTHDLTHVLPRLRRAAGERLLVVEGPTGATAHHVRAERGRDVPLASLAEVPGADPEPIGGASVPDDVRRAAALAFKLRRVAGVAATVGKVRELAGALQRAEEGIETGTLSKGAMQRLAPMDPHKLPGRRQVGQWVHGTGPMNQPHASTRDAIPRLEGPARERMLHKLRGLGEVRRDPNTGTEQILLHRALQRQHAPDALETPGVVTHEGVSSWSPDRYAVKEHADRYGGPVVSAWVNTQDVHNMPNMYGATGTQPSDAGFSRPLGGYEPVRGPSHFAHELEVLVSPGGHARATPADVPPVSRPDAAINKRVEEKRFADWKAKSDAMWAHNKAVRELGWAHRDGDQEQVAHWEAEAAKHASTYLKLGGTAEDYHRSTGGVLPA